MDNPFAFPLRARSDGSIFERSHEGMTLRDWFAGQALISMGQWCPPGCEQFNADFTMRARADWAYRHADALLAARTNGGQSNG